MKESHCDTHGTSELTCPYCGYVDYYCWDVLTDSDCGKELDYECSGCGKTMGLFFEVVPKFYTQQKINLQ
jgi:hypothetical protein